MGLFTKYLVVALGCYFGLCLFMQGLSHLSSWRETRWERRQCSNTLNGGAALQRWLPPCSFSRRAHFGCALALKVAVEKANLRWSGLSRGGRGEVAVDNGRLR